MIGIIIFITIASVSFALCFAISKRFGVLAGSAGPVICTVAYSIFADRSRSAADFYPMAELGLNIMFWVVVVSSISGVMFGIITYLKKIVENEHRPGDH